MDELITVATFWDIFDADFTKMMLDLEGIPSILDNRHLIVLRWDYANATGGVRLKVRKADAERAAQLLRDKPIRPDSTKHAISDADYELACPYCGSLDVRYEKLSRCVFFLTWLILGFPIIIPRRRFKCRNCRHGWKPL